MMMKKKMLMVSIALLLAIFGLAKAATVFNVDLNGYTYNEDAEEYEVVLVPYGQYDGNAPAGVFNDGINRWNVLVGGWGVRMNPTSIPDGTNWQMTKIYLGWEDLANVYFSTGSGGGDGLWGDYAYQSGTTIPVLSIIGGVDVANGSNYSQGVFDLYLFTNRPSDYTITAKHPDGTSANYSISLPGHDPNDPNFIVNQNYVVLENINSSDWINIALNSGRLCGMQLVSKGIKVPSTLSLPGDNTGAAGTDFSTTWAGFAHEITNISTGPYLYSEASGFNILAQTYPGEWLVYDMYVEDGNYAGFYEINAACGTQASGVQLGFQIDDGPMAVANVGIGNWGYASYWTNFSQGRLYLSKGYHRLKVSIIGGGVNIFGFRIRKAVDQNVSTCFDAQLKGSDLLDSDLNADCTTNFKDLAEFASEWLNKCAGCQ
ncbi:MAG: hypothetical protein A2Y12_02715 [Planctomycetes bacterium GWF2_42_9]|nr:MAG: hypothetical protein A2Y12_02715 [Planctomycetes bacterium GWF2_42_9]